MRNPLFPNWTTFLSFLIRCRVTTVAGKSKCLGMCVDVRKREPYRDPRLLAWEAKKTEWARIWMILQHSVLLVVAFIIIINGMPNKNARIHKLLCSILFYRHSLSNSSCRYAVRFSATGVALSSESYKTSTHSVDCRTYQTGNTRI